MHSQKALPSSAVTATKDIAKRAVTVAREEGTEEEVAIVAQDHDGLAAAMLDGQEEPAEVDKHTLDAEDHYNGAKVPVHSFVPHGATDTCFPADDYFSGLDVEVSVLVAGQP